jgi:CubicO group peptidase (beta-lactamase class C family)
MVPMKKLAALVSAVWLIGTTLALAQGLPQASPASQGMSAERLQQLSAAMKAAADAGKVAGTVTLVARNGKVVHYDASGQRDVEASQAMTPDTIFRIASMSKAVTSVAVMMLVEEGKVLLDDPVSRFIPSFAKTTVVVRPPAGSPASALSGTAPALRPITIRHLLTHTSGVSYGSGNPLEERYKETGVIGWYFAHKSEPIAASIDRLAALPFDYQPGERYIYGFNTDILGVVVEKASGQTLDEFFRTRIFEPLEMPDTHFYLPADKRSRLATVYSLASLEGRITRAPQAMTGQGDYVDGPRMSYSGGAGLLSTASDYARFLQMLLNGGELDGVRLLSPKTVELMTSNHVGDFYQNGRLGFGLGFEITEHVGRSGRHGSVGEYGWGGAYFTKYWVDPLEKIVVVFMTQLLPASGLDLQSKLRTLVYSAVVDSHEPVLATAAAR